MRRTKSFGRELRSVFGGPPAKLLNRWATFRMLDRSFLSQLKSLVIGALVVVMVLGGTVAITPRYIFSRYSDVCCPDPGEGYDWLGIFVVVPFVVGVAVVMAMVKSWLDDRPAKTYRFL